MAGYLTHPEARFFLFFLERGAQGAEKLIDFPRVIFLSDLSTQIPDSLGHVLRTCWGIILPGSSHLTT